MEESKSLGLKVAMKWK